MGEERKRGVLWSMDTGVGNLKQELNCIDEPLQPLHGLCYRTSCSDIFQIVQLFHFAFFKFLGAL